MPPVRRTSSAGATGEHVARGAGGGPHLVVVEEVLVDRGRAAAPGGRTAARRRWRSRWPPARRSASARPTSDAAERGRQPGLVEPVAPGHQRHHQRAVEGEHQRLHDLAHLDADGAGGVLGGAGALRELPQLELEAQLPGGGGDPRGVRMHCRHHRARMGRMRDWVVGRRAHPERRGRAARAEPPPQRQPRLDAARRRDRRGRDAARGPHPRGRGGDRAARHRVGGPGLRGALRGARPGLAPPGRGARAPSPTRASCASTTPTASWSTPASSTSTPAARWSPAATRGCASRWGSGWPSAGHHHESRPYGFHVAGALPDEVVVTRV